MTDAVGLSDDAAPPQAVSPGVIGRRLSLQLSQSPLVASARAPRASKPGQPSQNQRAGGGP